MTKKEAFDEINQLQNEYIDELVNKINSPKYEMMKSIDFTSATGTGKTKMMSKLINRFPDYYFIVTTLSKGQLHLQVRDNLEKDCDQDNFYVYGSADYRINSRLHAEDIISRIPEWTKCIWLRDEGHIKTNRFDELLADVCYKIVNFSATNIHSDIQCNFTQTMMLRTVNQNCGTPEDAIKKLLEVKEVHKDVLNYNPCGIFRCISGDSFLYNQIVFLCNKYQLKYIDITEDDYVMAELCEDDNEYDVIINKFKIVEGIDIKRAHVLYMDNQPSNNATTIQVIGRCRRNALLYRDDIDILAPENKQLLEATRECYVYYNVKEMKIDTNSSGELQYAFCNYISCEMIKANSIIEVTNGKLLNGLTVLELQNCTGTYQVKKDSSTGFNVVEPKTSFYEESITNSSGTELKFLYAVKAQNLGISNIDKFEGYKPYQKVFNDIELAIIGTDLMRQIRADDGKSVWVEMKAVSSKSNGYNKLSSFISQKYTNELEQASKQYFTGNNNFEELNSKCNSIVGYCVEYYSKWLVYGDSYLYPFLGMAQREYNTKLVTDCVVIRACMMKYKDMMMHSYGKIVSKVIKNITPDKLVEDEYNAFTNLIIELGTKTANFVKANLYSDRPALNNIDPNLSVKHIAGLADYITEDIILDVKVLNHIDEKCVKQVLAYHYLSTKRSDLHIKKVMIFDATSGKSVIIDINNSNLKN